MSPEFVARLGSWLGHDPKPRSMLVSIPLGVLIGMAWATGVNGLAHGWQYWSSYAVMIAVDGLVGPVVRGIAMDYQRDPD